MKRKNKASVSAEEMELTLLPESAPDETGIHDELKAAAPETEELPPEETDGEIPDDECLPETEEAPSADVPTQTQKSKEKGILGICLPLIIICIGVSLMLALVNALTADTIAAQAAAEKERAVMAIFPDATSAQLYEITEDGEIYLAIRENALLGCCISLTSGGFAGDISMMVGRSAAGEICGVQLISMSESPGIGTKTKNAAFLSQYRGGETFVIGKNVDAIAGATVSSRAVTDGVNRALDVPLDFSAIAGAYGLTVSADTGTASETVTVPPETDTMEMAPSEESAEDSETTESTSSLLAMPAISPAPSVNRVVLVSTTRVTEVETEAIETEPEMPETEIPEETDKTPAESEETSPPDESASTEEAETSDETTGPSETDIPEETADSPDAENTAATDTTTEPEPVDSAVTEPDSEAAAA